MALPLILGLLGSTLGAGTALGAVGAGALASGVGRFLETGDFEEGLKTGATSFLGGKLLGSVLGGAGDAGTKLSSAANTGTPLFQQPGFDPTKLTPDLSKFSGTFGQRLAATAADPVSLGQATLAQATVPPPQMPEMEEVEFENRQAGIPARTTVRPPAGYRPGFDAEIDYGVSPNFGVGLMDSSNPRYMSNGGLANPEKADLDNDGELSSYERRRGAAIEKSIAEQGKFAGGLLGLLSNEKVQDLLGNMGKTGKGFGLAALMDTPQARAEYNFMQTGEYSPQEQGMREGGMPETMEDDTLAETMATGMAETGDMREIIMNAVRALQGLSKKPEEDLQVFIETFGAAALTDLRMKVASGEVGGREGGLRGLIEGKGDGMSDDIDASLVSDMSMPSDQGQPLKVADGEYVVAADVVSGLGNGSTDAGARKLDDFMKRVRMARTDTTKQAPEIDPEKMMPV